jgi:hypothetical protein
MFCETQAQTSRNPSGFDAVLSSEYHLAGVRRGAASPPGRTGSPRGIPSESSLILGVGAEQRDSDAQQTWQVSPGGSAQ